MATTKPKLKTPPKILKVDKKSDSRHFYDTDKFYDGVLGAKKDTDSFYIQEKTTVTYGDNDQSYTQDYLYAPKNGEGVHQPKISVEYWGTNVHLEDKTKKKKSDEETVEDDDSDIEIESDEEVSTSKWKIAWNNAKEETESKMFKNMLLAKKIKSDGLAPVKQVLHHTFDVTVDAYAIMQKDFGTTIEELVAEAEIKVKQWLDKKRLETFCPETLVVSEFRILSPYEKEVIQKKKKEVQTYWKEERVESLDGYLTRYEAAEIMKEAAKTVSDLPPLQIIVSEKEISDRVVVLRNDLKEAQRDVLDADPDIKELVKACNKKEYLKLQEELLEIQLQYLHEKIKSKAK